MTRGDPARDQQEANERLLLAALRADEQRDVAEVARADAEAQLSAMSEKERALRDNAESRERVLGVVGHDLRNPLAAITMATCLLETEPLSDNGRRMVRLVARAARRMDRLIEQLLDVTRLRMGGGLALRLMPVDLRAVIGQVVAELEVASGSRIDCVTVGDLAGVWDADRLAQAISNLLGNALDHAAPGSAPRVEAHDEGANVVVAVSNTGEPIPADAIPFIMEPFRRGSTQPGTSAHLGLGLYVANQIVLAHGGELGARSERGTTTFTMTLPRAHT